MDKLSYAIGIDVAHSIINTGVDSFNMHDFTTGVKDILDHKKPALTKDELVELRKVIYASRNKKQESFINAHKKCNELNSAEVLKKYTEEEGGIATESGICYKVITEGTGKKPDANSRIRYHFIGSNMMGKTEFESGDKDDVISNIIKGLQIGIQMMSEGSTYEFLIPADLAYGDKGLRGKVEPYNAVFYTIELKEVL